MSRALSVALLLMLPSLSLPDDFPTDGRVESMRVRMNENAGQSRDTLYPLVCLVGRFPGRYGLHRAVAGEATPASSRSAD